MISPQFSFIIVLVIIILLIVIIGNITVKDNNYCSNFTIKPIDMVVNGYVDTSERYYYPCPECISIRNKLKPKFIYDFSDNRCAKNTDQYTDSSVLNNLINYQIEPNNTIYKSCTGGYNSLYSYANGRFIKIVSTTGPIFINKIEVKNKYDNNLLYGASIYAYPFISGIYPETILNSTNESFRTGYNKLAYILIDLKTIKEIAYINIFHNNDANSINSLIGATLYIANTYSNGDDIGKIVFNKNITDYVQNRVIITQNNNTMPISYTPGVMGYSGSTGINVVDTINWPCANCFTGPYLYTGFYYNNGTGPQCFKSIANDTPPSILQGYIDNKKLTTADSILNSYFKTCSPLSDTRLLTLPTFVFFRFDNSVNITESSGGNMTTVIRGNPTIFNTSGSSILNINGITVPGVAKLSGVNFVFSYVQAAGSDLYIKANENFTIQGWFYLTQYYGMVGTASYWSSICQLAGFPNDPTYKTSRTGTFILYRVDYYIAGSSFLNMSAKQPTLNTWHFFTINRNLTNNTVNLYVDGILVASLAVDRSLEIGSPNDARFIIGSSGGIDEHECLNGYVSEYYFVKGISLDGTKIVNPRRIL